MDENLSLLKQQAYYKGYLEGYRRGVEDAAVGKAGAQTESGKLDCPIQFLNLSVLLTVWIGLVSTAFESLFP